ncbi:MAG: carboxypeptidase-like regulatory domain-containing protein [Bacteroidales bacterium]|nr:carboxypeptidase-like regulatory domain-containing protein [Bacteroidales bacterium]
MNNVPQFFLTCFLSILGFWGVSQNEILIVGKVTDMETGSPLLNANITVLEFSIGTITSKEGTFNLVVNELPAVLKISHVGYEAKFIRISEIPTKEVIIQLKQKTLTLDEVIVSDVKIEAVFRNDNYSVLDYEFYEDNLLLLVYRYNFSKSELILLNNSNDTIVRLNELPGKPRSIYKDCMGYIHLLCNEFAYQLFISENQIELLFPTSINEFAKLIYPCVAFLKDKYYIRLYYYNNLITEYQYVKEGTKELKRLRRIVDIEKSELIKSNPYHKLLLSSSYMSNKENQFLNMGSDVPMEIQIEMLEALRANQYESHYLEKMIYTPVYAPLINLNDTLLIFNHPENQIEFYSYYDSLIKKIAINYHSLKDWKELIVADENHQKVYTLFQHSGTLDLREIDLRNGKLGTSNKLYYPFVKNIKIRNGFVYFIHKNHSTRSKMKLYKQRL